MAIVKKCTLKALLQEKTFKQTGNFRLIIHVMKYIGLQGFVIKLLHL